MRVAAALCGLLPFLGLAQAQDRPIVAVFEIEDRSGQLDAKTLDQLTDYLGSLMARKGYQVVPRSQLRERLVGAKTASYRDCYDQSCQIEIGKELAAQKTLACQVLKLGKSCKVTVNLFDLKKSASEGAGTASGECGEDEVVASLEEAVKDLFGGQAGAEAAPAEPQPRKLGYAELAVQAAAEEEQRRADLKKAWQEVTHLAFDRVTPHAARAVVLRKFLQDYPSSNPHDAEAREYLARLERGREPMPLAWEVDWVFSDPAGIELTKSEITVAQYKGCVEAGKCSAPDTGGSCNWSQAGREAHPVNCVDWSQAIAFCAWAGGRLPTQQEWFTEASNGGKQKFPWGEESVSCDRAIWNQGGPGCGKGGTWPVCSKPAGNSVSGLCDLSGNLWEWTSTSKGDDRVMCGGSWGYTDPDYLRASTQTGNAPSRRSGYVGFRCVRSMKP
jgi:iron(II)-dependent oxidoreductase